MASAADTVIHESANIEKEKTTCVAIIDGEGEFICNAEEISDLANLNQDNNGQYSVISILGCQSSGKSTLLNLLFGTDFNELDASAGRQRTTQGVWLGSSPKVSGLLIMDLEGTDSVSRGSERHPFERQSALFALSVADVVILNMWQHDIGRYVASNYGVLATVFDVNLQLLASSSDRSSRKMTKTTLLFTIRDYAEGDSSLEIISQQLKRDMEQIWSEITIPEALDPNLKPHDIFELQFCGLAHKRYEADKFHQDIDLLRDRFAKTPSGILLAPQERKSCSVPASALGRYLSDLWRAIQSHRDLNLPTQKEMLAAYKCDEISNEIINSFVKTQLVNIDKSDESGIQTKLEHLAERALQNFDNGTRGYHPETVEKKRSILAARINEELQPILREIFDKKINMVLSAIKYKINNSIDSKRCNDDYSGLVKTILKEAENEFTSVYNRVMPRISDHSGAIEKGLEHELQQLRLNASPIIENGRSKNENALQFEIDSYLERNLISDIRMLLTNYSVKRLEDSTTSEDEIGEQSLWNTVAKKTDECVKDLTNNIVESKWRNLSDCDSPEESIDVHLKARQLVVAELRQQVKYIKMKVRSVFDKAFKLDETGLPRLWHQVHNIRELYLNAKLSALSVLDLLKDFKVDTDDRWEPVELLSNSKYTDTKEQIEAEMTNALRAAENAQDRAEAFSKMPMWVLPVIAILGFNEFMTLISNPILLILALIMGSIVVALYYLNMLGTALTFSRIAAQQISMALFETLHQITGSMSSNISESPASVELARRSRQESRASTHESD